MSSYLSAMLVELGVFEEFDFLVPINGYSIDPFAFTAVVLFAILTAVGTKTSRFFVFAFKLTSAAL